MLALLQVLNSCCKYDVRLGGSSKNNCITMYTQVGYMMDSQTCEMQNRGGHVEEQGGNWPDLKPDVIS